MKTVIILDSHSERIKGFRQALESIDEGLCLKIWHDASTMIDECEANLEHARLISLDTDLLPHSDVSKNPSDGFQVAKLLAGCPPVCPIIIHSEQTEHSWSMRNELRFAGWEVHQVVAVGDRWISKQWLPKAREALENWKAPHIFRKPGDHQARMDRALLSLEGLGIGDAVGEMLSYRHQEAKAIISEDRLPAGPWFHTDDTEMAISVLEVLRLLGHAHQDSLSRRFVRRFEMDAGRGYGRMTRIQMREVAAGADWRETAGSAFGGQGSMGNGSAMRVAPLGAYFSDDLDRVVSEAALSSTVTHTHQEAIAGAIAVAVAASMAWRQRDGSNRGNRSEFFDAVLTYTPESNVRQRLMIASTTPFDVGVEDVAKALGNGSLVTAPDTVPFAIWCAARRLNNFVDALTSTIACGGDCDTNAAIVGGIVALSAGRESIPSEWRRARERLPFDALKAPPHIVKSNS